MCSIGNGVNPFLTVPPSLQPNLVVHDCVHMFCRPSSIVVEFVQKTKKRRLWSVTITRFELTTSWFTPYVCSQRSSPLFHALENGQSFSLKTAEIWGRSTAALSETGELTLVRLQSVVLSVEQFLFDSKRCIWINLKAEKQLSTSLST